MSGSYTMLVPFLPMYLMQDLGVPNDDVKLWTGAIFSVTFLVSTVMAPIWGKLADSKGRKLMAIRASVSLAIAYILGGLCQTPEQLFMVRVLQGFASGLFPAVIVICSGFLPPEKVGWGLGVIQAGQTSGQAVGPLIGGAMATMFGIRPSFFISATLLTLITLLIWFLVPEPPKGEAKATNKKAKPQVSLLKRLPVLEILGYACIIKVVHLLIQPIIVIYITELDPTNPHILFLSGLVFSLLGIASAITSPSWGDFGQQFGFYRVMAMSAFCSAVTVSCCALPKTIWLFGIAFFIYGSFFSGVVPTLNSAMVREVEPEHRGLAFGYIFSSEKFGSMFGPLIGGIIATYYPMSYVFYACGFFLLLLAMLIYQFHLRKGDYGLF